MSRHVRVFFIAAMSRCESSLSPRSTDREVRLSASRAREVLDLGVAAGEHCPRGRKPALLGLQAAVQLAELIAQRNGGKHRGDRSAVQLPALAIAARAELGAVQARGLAQADQQSPVAGEIAVGGLDVEAVVELAQLAVELRSGQRQAPGRRPKREALVAVDRRLVTVRLEESAGLAQARKLGRGRRLFTVCRPRVADDPFDAADPLGVEWPDDDDPAPADPPQLRQEAEPKPRLHALEHIDRHGVIEGARLEPERANALRSASPSRRAAAAASRSSRVIPLSGSSSASAEPFAWISIRARCRVSP